MFVKWTLHLRWRMAQPIQSFLDPKQPFLVRGSANGQVPGVDFHLQLQEQNAYEGHACPGPPASITVLAVGISAPVQEGQCHPNRPANHLTMPTAPAATAVIVPPTTAERTVRYMSLRRSRCSSISSI